MNDVRRSDDDVMRAVVAVMDVEAERLNAGSLTVDLIFLAYLRHMSRFGFFSFGPINIDVDMIEDIVDRTIPKRGPGEPLPALSDDHVRMSQQLMEEVRRSGRRRIDELHYLLAFMRCNEGLPKRVFGELGITPEQIEEYARTRAIEPPPLEKLYSPEDAAAYLNVHVQTVRAWIRSGRLRARRLAGQRALRITASDLQSVLEPVDPESVQLAGS
ncbi:MAG TPA: helix-turn-helix domain-containing protein [Dehalococcoidia bacterium]|nr:helix-turn-helix domain-containing protein [Dehalococcoidia bacterium]